MTFTIFSNTAAKEIESENEKESTAHSSPTHSSLAPAQQRARSYVKNLLRDPRTRSLSRDPRLEKAFKKAYCYQSPMREWILVQEMISFIDVE